MNKERLIEAFERFAVTKEAKEKATLAHVQATKELIDALRNAGVVQDDLKEPVLCTGPAF